MDSDDNGETDSEDEDADSDKDEGADCDEDEGADSDEDEDANTISCKNPHSFFSGRLLLECLTRATM